MKVVEEGESGSGGSSGGDGGVGCVNVCFAVTRSNNDARALNRGRPKPNIRFCKVMEIVSRLPDRGVPPDILVQSRRLPRGPNCGHVSRSFSLVCTTGGALFFSFFHRTLLQRWMEVLLLYLVSPLSVAFVDYSNI